MPATLKFTHEIFGEYTFPQEKIPLISRRITAQRINEHAGGHQRIDITFTGYVSEQTHPEVMTKHNQLIAITNGHRVSVYYHDGINIILNNQLVYMDGIGEAEQWRQRIGDYSITGYYFIPIEQSYKEIYISYSSVNGTHVFRQLPIIGISKTRARSSGRANERLPSGRYIGAEVAMLLSGEIAENTHTNLLAEKASIEAAFSRDGSLTYGNLTFACHASTIQWAPMVPMHYWPFSIELNYFIDDVTAFECSVQYSRITLNPVIHENPNCPQPPIVLNRFPQGQWVDYNFHIEGESLIVLRSILLSEVMAVVAPNGFEPPGGKELHNIQEPRIDLNFTKFYKTPILQDLG